MPIPPEWSLSGKVALVAGNGRGWTPVLACALAEAGAGVVVADRSRKGVDEAVSAVHGIKGWALGIPADMSEHAEVRGTVAQVVRDLGSIDILVNNAAVEFFKPFLEISAAEFQRAMELNVRSVFLCCQEAGRQMLRQGGGRIVNITSVLGERGLWNGTAYCATMGAVQQLTKALALEWARSNIRVNAIGAGWFSPEEIPAEEAQKNPLVRYLPARRLGHPRDIGPLLVFLASDASEYATGHTFFVDGGAMAHA